MNILNLTAKALTLKSKLLSKSEPYFQNQLFWPNIQLSWVDFSRRVFLKIQKKITESLNTFWKQMFFVIRLNRFCTAQLNIYLKKDDFIH